jgi:hypothetical protein
MNRRPFPPPPLPLREWAGVQVKVSSPNHMHRVCGLNVPGRAFQSPAETRVLGLNQELTKVRKWGTNNTFPKLFSCEKAAGFGRDVICV